MSDRITHRAFFGTGDHAFTLTDPMVEELERITGTGFGAIFEQVSRFTLQSAHLVEIIRLGLIGAGMNPEQAQRVVQTYGRDRPMMETMTLALEIIAARWLGVDDEPAPANHTAAVTGDLGAALSVAA